MPRSPARNPKAKIREFSPETEWLLRRRLLLYKRRTGKTSNDAIVTELNMWEGLVRWYPKAFSAPSAPIFSRRKLDTWIVGDTSHGERSHTKPAGPLLTIIAEFLLENRSVFDFELTVDEEGFGLAAALQQYLQSPENQPPPAMEGEYEAYTDDGESLMLHHLTVVRDREEDIFLIEYKAVKTFRRQGDQRDALRKRLSDVGLFAIVTLRKGWAVYTSAQCIGFIRHVGALSSTPEPWLWSYKSASETRTLRTLSGGGKVLPEATTPDPAYGHLLPVMKSLTLGDDISYLSRKGGFDLAIIREIMDKRNEPKLSQLDRDFLRAAWRCDPDLATEALEKGANINAVDPESGLTALLYAAAGGVGGMVELLSAWPELNPTITDKHGHLPSDIVPYMAELTPLVEKLIDLEVSYEENHTPHP